MTKGIQTLIKCAIKVNHNVLEKYLLEVETTNTRVKIHHACQKSAYGKLKRWSTNPCSSRSISKVAKVVMRSVIEMFNLKEKWFIYGKLCFKDNTHAERNSCILDAALRIRETILNICSQRKNKRAKEWEWGHWVVMIIMIVII